MKNTFILLFLITVISCKKDSEVVDTTPKTFCWSCKQTRNYSVITDCNGMRQGPAMTPIITLPCNMTEADAKKYEDDLKTSTFTQTGFKGDATHPCKDYYSLQTSTIGTCTKLGAR